MALLTKVITVSELEQIESVINDLNGSSIASAGLIEQSVKDLKDNNEKIQNERKGISEMINQLKEKESKLEKIYNENETFIKKVELAFMARKEVKNEK
jgi:hypothetical protein